MNKSLKFTLLSISLLFLTGCSSGVDVAFLAEESIDTKQIDSKGQEGLNTVFGDRIVASRVPSLAAQFQYPLNTNDLNVPIIITTGNIDYHESMLELHTGTSSTGSIIIQSTNYVRYIPGHEIQGLFTPIFSDNINIIQKTGLFDGADGFYIKWDGVDLSACKIRISVESCEVINLVGIFDGIDLDPTKGNIYSISFGYLGFAPITYSVMAPDGGWKILHKMKYPNSETDTHITQTFLPMRAESTNLGNTLDTILRLGSVWGGIVDGAIEAGTKSDPTARFFTAESETITGSNGVIFAFKSKDQFGGIDNRVSSLLKLITCSTEGNKPVHFKLLKQPDYVSATWVNVSVNSVLQMSTNLVLNTGAEEGEIFLPWDMSKSDAFYKNVEAENLLLPPNGVAVFYFESQNSNEVQCSIRWAELF